MAKRSEIVLKLPKRVYPINSSGILMIGVKTSIKVIVKIGNDATGNRDAHAKHIGENEKLILGKTAEGNKQVIFDHSRKLLGYRHPSIHEGCMQRVKKNANHK
jgi:hypothetical protein